jgi:hypothetical protein
MFVGGGLTVANDASVVTSSAMTSSIGFDQYG